jgi:DNA modification methylase/RNA polymerase-interacting CarD/CdnL/TRCF family regulator
VIDLETVHIPAQLLICEDGSVDPNLDDLVESIKSKGLLHPITVQALNSLPDGTQQFKVVAGRRRLKACQILGVGSIPCRITSGEETEIKLISLEENLQRVNLPWWEFAELVSKWHDTKQQIHGVSEPIKGKKSRENPGWSMRDTAQELHLSLGFVSEAAMLDRAVKRDPSLRNIKDRDTAVRLVRSAAKRIESEMYAEMPVDFRVNQVYNGSAADILKQFDGHTFNACFTDPPWLKYIDAKLTRDDETLPVFKEIYRVLKADAFLYMFVGFDDFYSYSRQLPQMGFTVSKTPLLWVKKSIQDNQLHGMVLSKGARSWEYSRDFELILLAVKGSPALVQSVQKSSIKIYPPIPPVSLSHPNEKPLPLLKDLLGDFSHEGSIILDPFAGSGSHLHACKDTRRRYIGIERDHKFYEQIVERLK